MEVLQACVVIPSLAPSLTHSLLPGLHLEFAIQEMASSSSAKRRRAEGEVEDDGTTVIPTETSHHARRNDQVSGESLQKRWQGWAELESDPVRRLWHQSERLWLTLS